MQIDQTIIATQKTGFTFTCNNEGLTVLCESAADLLGITSRYIKIETTLNNPKKKGWHKVSRHTNSDYARFLRKNWYLGIKQINYVAKHTVFWMKVTEL